MIYRLSAIVAVIAALLVPSATLAKGHGGHGSHYSHGYVTKHGTYVHGGYHKNPKPYKHKKHG
jgi:hypothetical protein